HPRQPVELRGAQPLLRAAEAERARAWPEPLEDREHDVRLASPERADRDSVDVGCLHGGMVAAAWPAPPRRDGPSSPAGPFGPLRCREVEPDIRFGRGAGRRVANPTGAGG